MNPIFQNLQVAFFVAFLLTFVIEFPYMVKSVGFLSAIFWVWLDWPMKVFMPSGTEYDRLFDDVPEWIKRAQIISISGVVGFWLLAKASTHFSN